MIIANYRHNLSRLIDFKRDSARLSLHWKNPQKRRTPCPQNVRQNQSRQDQAILWLISVFEELGKHGQIKEFKAQLSLEASSSDFKASDHRTG